ncbi:MAG TPA: hypothetical protein VE954_14030 [Oligoflexus sp.]|uniref:hypothetical protein n=1 Tax=Oligoflexus sp. TaxID=1971216 RepID=UPI002D41392A|nr:hypothetical protein [Oligoflexus sp.]HYX34219.1 hypothetical protein [Oligoflexus sp.]
MAAVKKAEKSEPAQAEDRDIFAKAAPDIVLYQWPASQNCDSIYVRCTKIHRFLGYLHAPYNVADISFPKTSNQAEISDKVAPLMRKLPIIRINDTNYVEGTDKIVSWLVERHNCQDFLNTDESQKTQLWFLDHWAERWLVWLVIYGRWFKEENYVNFVKSFTAIKSSHEIPRAIEYIKMRACTILKTTEVGGMKHSEYVQQLSQGAEMLNRILEKSEFISGPVLRECDLTIFMSIQALLDPALEDESKLLQNFGNLVRWAKKVDEMTKTPHSKPISLG